jgi:nucleotide-binding universal stress UspA family protein
MKIVLAADGSEYTRRAAMSLVGIAAELARKPEIHVLNVHMPIPYARAASVAGKSSVDRYHEEECRKALAPAEKVLDKAGLAYESAWIVGEPAAEIAAYAAKKKADLIVMGSHGHGALRKLALGSVGVSVLAAAKCPVVIVK